MRRVDGEEDNALTRGGLRETRSKLRNPVRESRLSVQKSADVIVHSLSRGLWKDRTSRRMETKAFGIMQ